MFSGLASCWMGTSEAVLAPSLGRGKGERADALMAGLAVPADSSLCTTATCAQRGRPKALSSHRQASCSLRNTCRASGGHYLPGTCQTNWVTQTADSHQTARLTRD